MADKSKACIIWCLSCLFSDNREEYGYTTLQYCSNNPKLGVILSQEEEEFMQAKQIGTITSLAGQTLWLRN
jgi:hypothetical protein